MLPYIVFGVGVYLLYKELTQKKEEEPAHEKSGDHSNLEPDPGSSDPPDPKPNRNRVTPKSKPKKQKKEEKPHVQQDEPISNANEPGDPGGDKPGSPGAEAGQGGVEDETTQ
ncbi:MAG: hypothetical protein PVG39_11350 [Desulfobacteraceae bacterium]|jgi:cell division protein FtsN